MKAFIFPGQGSQFPGMAKSFYDKSKKARTLFNNANDILGFEITKIMFEGNELDLKQTNVTQPAIFLHSVVLAKILENDFKPDMVAGHSLGEFSALVANNSLDFECGLKLVAQRAKAMQKACESNQGTSILQNIYLLESYKKIQFLYSSWNTKSCQKRIQFKCQN